ncbi:hypothetical protein ElyMa_003211700 [Elysia marginata]|uniref:Uncharacterized protein n=1 Tax=Elysia marginata TaxID=1093978 RepID=A0AAV4J246_9GAST|nr:hypothetical protein ElyMa_003211700 [Elysia marginata]
MITTPLSAAGGPCIDFFLFLKDSSSNLIIEASGPQFMAARIPFVPSSWAYGKWTRYQRKITLPAGLGYQDVGDIRTEYFSDSPAQSHQYSFDPQAVLSLSYRVRNIWDGLHPAELVHLNNLLSNHVAQINIPGTETVWLSGRHAGSTTEIFAI